MRPRWQRLDRRRASIIIFLALFVSFYGFSADTNSPAIATTTNAKADTNLLGSFKLERGFRIELVASEPMVTVPVAMAFDENGRLFVAEMRDYPDRRGANPHLGQVRMLENMNDEGVFQNSTVYADNLAWPSAVACYAGGIFVAAAPDIFYLKDSKGDGVVDTRQVVISGFGATNFLNPDFLPNSFNWGVDNRIHGASGGVGGEISARNNANGLVSIDGCDFAFDPRTLEVFAETGPAQTALSFNSRGRTFVSDFSVSLLSPMYELRYTLRNPFYPKPAGLVSIVDPAERVYPFTPQPSGGRQTNAVPRPMTRVRGSVVYRGLAFPSTYFDNVFVADSDAHVIHRMVVQENDLELNAQRVPVGSRTEFLSSSDPAFNPMQIINGPDGALYVADRREGYDRGRIYRILPERTKRSKPPQLGKAKTYDLASALAQGGGWHRDTAARLLYERKDPAAPALLRATLSGSRIPQGRIRALHALAGSGELTESDVLKALGDSDADVREHALSVCETLFTKGDASENLLGQLRGMVSDPSLRVRYQLAFTLGQLDRPDKGIALGRILARDASNRWVRNAVLSSAGTGAGNLFTVLAGDSSFRAAPVGAEFLQQLALMIGVSGHLDAVTQTASFLARGSLNAAQSYGLLYELGNGLHRTRSSFPLVDTQGTLQPFYASALNIAVDTSQPQITRTFATQLLGVSDYKLVTIVDFLTAMLDSSSSPALQLAAIETLSRYDEPLVVGEVARRWGILAPVIRSPALTCLLARDGHIAPVLAAIQAGQIPLSDFSSAHRNFLRTYPMTDIQSRAIQLLGPVPGAKPEVMARFKPALTMRSVAARGREIFRQRCADCHQGQQSDPVGPNLQASGALSKNELLSRIIAPNQGVRSDYVTQILESKEGERFVGILTEQNPLTVTLNRTVSGKLVWPQVNLRGIAPRTWSLMPDGLEQGMSVQDMADLLEFISQGAR